MKLNIALAKAKAILSSVKMSQEQLVDKSLIQYDTPEIEEGGVIYLSEGPSDWSILPDGQYQTAKNASFVIEAGVVTKVSNQKTIETSDNGPVKQAMDKHEMEETELAILPPAAGAPADLVNPDEISADSDYATCMAALNEANAAHGALQQAHNKLRSEHDAARAKINELANSHNSLANKLEDLMAKMSQKVTKLSGELEAKVVKLEAEKTALEAKVEKFGKLPAGQPADTLKGTIPVNPDIQQTRAYQILNSK